MAIVNAVSAQTQTVADILVLKHSLQRQQNEKKNRNRNSNKIYQQGIE